MDAPKNCLNCHHHRFDTVAKNILCLHPERPPQKAVVVRWFVGCPQFEPKKDETNDDDV